MPTYQYACTDCGEQLEAVQKFTDDPLTVCPACNGKLRKLFSAVGIVFKGSGFYRTDSRNGSGSTAAKAANGSNKPDGATSSGDSAAKSGSGSESKSGSGSEGKSGSGSESKPAAKTGTGSGSSSSGAKVA